MAETPCCLLQSDTPTLRRSMTDAGNHSLLCVVNFRSQFDSLIQIEFQESFGRDTNWGNTSNEKALEFEVIIPVVFTRMEQKGDLSSLRIKSCKIWSLVSIAVGTCKRKVVERFVVNMLFGLYVLDVKRQKRSGILG